MNPTEPAISLSAAIDALYQAPLDQFVALRNALSTHQRKAGDRAAADEVKALAKPSAIAWAVNQAWWRDAAAVQRLLDASARQRAVLGAGPSQVRAAAEARAEAVTVVVDLVVAALGGPQSVTADTRHRIVGTVEALAAAGWPDGVRPGRLTRDLQPTGLEGLGLLAALADAASSSGPVTVGPTLVRSRPAASRRDGKGADDAAAGRPAAAGGSAVGPPPADRATADHVSTDHQTTDDSAVHGQTSVPTPVGSGASASASSGLEPRAGARPSAAELKRQAREAQREAARARVASLEVVLASATRDASERGAEEQRARHEADAAARRVAELDAALDQAREAARAARRAAAAATAALGEAELMRARTARDVAVARAALDALEDD